MYNTAISCTNCLKKQFVWRVKARRINIQRVESLSYAGVTPRSISHICKPVYFEYLIIPSLCEQKPKVVFLSNKLFIRLHVSWKRENINNLCGKSKYYVYVLWSETVCAVAWALPISFSWRGWVLDCRYIFYLFSLILSFPKICI